MKKQWNTPSIEEMPISATANGNQPSLPFDGDWTQINGKWYLPGSGADSSAAGKKG